MIQVNNLGCCFPFGLLTSILNLIEPMKLFAFVLGFLIFFDFFFFYFLTWPSLILYVESGKEILNYHAVTPILSFNLDFHTYSHHI